MRVAIIMGSTSDLAKVEPAITILKEWGVQTDVRCLSAHRAHEALSEFVSECNQNDTEAIICAAGMAAALPGVVAAQTVIPVIGVPLSASVLDGMDALMSIVQMPPSIPVATVGINNSYNAGMLAVQILSLKYPEIKEKLVQFRINMKEKFIKENDTVEL